MACRAAAGCRKLRDAAIDSHPQPGRGAARPRTAGAPPLEGMLGEGVSPRGPKPASRQNRVASAAVAARRLGGGRALGRGERGEPGLVTRLRSRLPRIRPFKALTVSVFSIALVGIVANAMVFQRGRHPAPLFGLGGSVDGQPDAAQRTVAVAPPPAPAPAADHTGTISPALTPVPAQTLDLAPPVAIAAPKPVPTHHVAAPKPHRQDGIGGLLAGTAPASATHRRPGHPAAKPEASHADAATAAAALAHPDAAPQVKGHTKPHAAKVASAKGEPAPSKPVTTTE